MSKIENSLYTKRYRYQTQGISFGCEKPVYTTVPILVGKIRTLNSDPLYKSKIASGANATLPYTSSIRTSVYKGGITTGVGINPAVSACKAYNTYNGINPFQPPEITNISTTNEAINSAAIGLLKKINKHQEMVSGLTIVGELRETVKMLRQPATALRLKTGLFCKDLRVKRSQVENWKQNDWKKLVADSWLEFTFGVKPLMNDIQGIADALVEFRDENIVPLRFTTTAKRSSQSARSSGIIGNAVMSYNIITSDETTVKWIAGIKDKALYDKPAYERLQALAGLDINHVVPAAWELVPFSFLVDYFTNIGDVISGAFVSTRDIVWTSRTVVNTSSWEYVNFRLSNTDPNWARFTMEKPPYQLATSRYIDRRAAMPSVSVSSVRLELPGFSLKWLNMAALAAQFDLFKKRK